MTTPTPDMVGSGAQASTTASRHWRWWEVTGAALALAAVSSTLGPTNADSRADYTARPQPSFAPPDWVFLPAWIVWKACAVRADTVLLNADPAVIGDGRRRRLIGLRALDWLLWTTTQPVALGTGSPRLGLVWTLGQLASTAKVAASTRRDLGAVARSLVPQLAWLGFATTPGLGQIRVQQDPIWARLRGAERPRAARRPRAR